MFHHRFESQSNIQSGSFFLKLVVCVLILFTFVSCSDDNTESNDDGFNDSQTVDTMNAEQGTNMQGDELPLNGREDGTKEAGEEQQGETRDDTIGEDDTSSSVVSVTVATIAEHIKVGMSQEEVEAFLGDAHQEVVASFDGVPAWRYDMTDQEGYSYDEETDNPDMEGLRKQDVDLQVFIYFDVEGTEVTGYTVYQNDGEGQIEAFYLFENGVTKWEQIE